MNEDVNIRQRSNHEQIEIEKYKSNIYRINLSNEDKEKIINFYLFNAPLIANSNKNDDVNLKRLSDYGWDGSENKTLQKLEKELINNSTLKSFVFKKAKSIKKTLVSLDLFGTKIIINDEKIVLTINGKATIDEDDIFSFVESETRMNCLFRHIRNSIAHNLTYVFPNNFILLLDFEGKTQTAAILLDIKTLIKWVDIVDYKGILKQ